MIHALVVNAIMVLCGLGAGLLHEKHPVLAVVLVVIALIVGILCCKDEPEENH